MDLFRLHHGAIDYYLKGEHPSLLILSGMHGDESGVIECVEKFVHDSLHILPSFLYIPRVSPSAVFSKSRLNAAGRDVNREFFTPPIDEEVRDCTQICSKYSFEISLDFHEDPDLTDKYYMYDSYGMNEVELKDFRNHLKSANIQAYNGLDDPGDPNLGFEVKDGYVPFLFNAHNPDLGFSSEWFLRHAISKRTVTLEIPGKASIDVKRAMIATMFAYFLPHLS